MTDPSTFPIHVANAFTDSEFSGIRSSIIQAIETPPFNGRGASSKSFAFLMTTGQQFSGLAQKLLGAFRRSSVHSTAVEMFGADYGFLLNYCAVRRQKPDSKGSALTLHFDGMFLGGDQPAVNFWIPFDDVGETAPGLSFISNKALEKHAWDRYCAKMESVGWETADPNLLDKMMTQQEKDRFRSFLYTPTAKAGDALVFGSGTLHATQEMSHWSGERVSVEFRLSKSAAPPSLFARRGGQIARLVGDGDNLRIAVRAMGDPSGEWRLLKADPTGTLRASN